MGSVAAWQARYPARVAAPLNVHAACVPEPSSERSHGDAAPEPATGQVSRSSGLHCSAARLEAPAERPAAKDLYEHGLGGGTMAPDRSPISSTLGGPGLHRGEPWHLDVFYNSATRKAVTEVMAVIQSRDGAPYFLNTCRPPHQVGDFQWATLSTLANF